MTTATLAKTSRSVKTGKLSVTPDRVQKISDITSKLLFGSKFPALKNIPNIHYVCMAIWNLESDLQLLRDIRGRITSRHYSSSEGSRIVSVDYKGSTNYRAFISRQDLTTEQKYNLEDGYYAHGLSAAMGGYFIRGTRANRQLAAYRPLIDSYSSQGIPLEINLGESMTSLFNGPNEDVSIEASIVQGLIILNVKYLIAVKNINNDPFGALLLAVGYYVGRGRDSNGYTGIDRILDVQNLTNSKLKILANNNIKPTDTSYFKDVGKKILVAQTFNKGAIQSGKTSTKATPIRVASADSVTNIKPNC